jgi:hypothetical protein
MTDLLTSIQAALGLHRTQVSFTASGALPSAFAVTDLACASIAAAGRPSVSCCISKPAACPKLKSIAD